jgi:hypothetical protein
VHNFLGTKKCHLSIVVFLRFIFLKFAYFGGYFATFCDLKHRFVT